MTEEKDDERHDFWTCQHLDGLKCLNLQKRAEIPENRQEAHPIIFCDSFANQNACRLAKMVNLNRERRKNKAQLHNDAPLGDTYDI